MFTPRHVKHSRLLLRHARKYLRYKRDLLSASDRDEIVAGIENLRYALHQHDRQRIHSTAEALDKTLHRLTPVTWESHWRENCEVILVAIVVAVGIRSYFLQPFKIPTGSMQPTLNGIIGRPSTKPAPNILRQIGEFIVLGRNYINVVSREDDQVLQIEQKKFSFSSPFHDSSASSKIFSSTRRRTLSITISTFFPAALIVAATSLPKAQWTRAIRSLSINSVITSLSRIGATFSFSGQIISSGFGRIRTPDRLSILSGLPACPETSCESTRLFSLSTAKSRKVLVSRE